MQNGRTAIKAHFYKPSNSLLKFQDPGLFIFLMLVYNHIFEQTDYTRNEVLIRS